MQLWLKSEQPLRAGSGQRRPQRRRGSATLWMVIWLPCLMVLFSVLVGVANLWLARVELENSLESAALAAVKHWGDAGGGDTLIPREVGVAYAHANCVRKVPVVIGTNYDPVDGGPNQNDLCEPTDENVLPPNGNLVFGAIDDSNPDNVIFNAGIMPACGAGLVVMDITSNGNLNDNQNEWGIAFHPTPEIPADLRIDFIIITIPRNMGVDAFFTDFELSPNDPGQFIVRDNSGYSQQDIFGFPNPSAQITASYPTPLQLRLDFQGDPMSGDLGFEPCDRVRFGNNVDFSVGGGSLPGNLRDADGLGQIGTKFEVHFSDGTVATGTFFNNTHTDCHNPAILSDVGCPAGPLATPPGTPKKYVSLTNVDDIPCPASSAANNNGQAIGFLSGGTNAKFGVWAQAIIPVSPLVGGSFLGFVPKYCVRSESVAEYDCATRRVALVRIHTFICPGPDEVVDVCKCRPISPP